jgi:hypothetical protein
MMKRLAFLVVWLPFLLLPVGGAPAALPGYTRLIIDPNPGNVPVEKLMADLNGDGKLDIIVGVEHAGLYWWAFPASGRITDPWPKSVIKSTGFFYEDLQPYDLNGDGRVDILACHDNAMYWYQNPGGNATGVWIEHFIGNGLGHDVRLADLDGDGRIDVATQFGIYFQNNPDSWTYRGFGSLKGMALLDIGSGRGAINLVINTPSGVTWYENPRETGGNARTGNWVARVIDGSTGSEEQPLASGRISNDGRMHLIGNPPGQGLVWWQAPADRRTGAWIKRTINGSYEAIHKIVVEDMDNNGTLDLVVGEQEQSHDPVGGPYTFNNDRVSVFYNNGAAGFTEQVLEWTGGQNNVAVDVDGDGDRDILSVNHGYYGAPHPIELFVNNLVTSGGGGGGGGPSPVVGNGTGLKGEYFDNTDFSALQLTRTDATVNFDWGSGSPSPAIGPDSFSVRWTGQVQAQFSETYTFTTVSDDGIRLWVNGSLVVNNWTDHAPTENSGTILLTAGQKVDLKMEFYENGGGAVARLLWSSPSTAKQAVRQSQLYPAAGGVPPPPPPPPSPSSNLARNPGFESDPNVDYFPYGSATFSWASDAAHGGSRSVKVQSVQPAGTLTRWLSKTNSIGAQAGGVYRASAWFRTSGVTDRAVITVNFWDANSVHLGSTDGGTLSGTSNWTLLTTQATAPANTAFVRVEFRLWGPGSMWADDVTLIRN